MQGLGLSPLRSRDLRILQSWPSHGILHVKRDWNRSANRLASTALHRQEGVVTVPNEERPDLEVINWLSELLIPKDKSPSVKLFAVTRARVPIKMSGETMNNEVVQQLRVDRIRKAQEEEGWMRDLKAYLNGNWGDLSVESARLCSKMSEYYEIIEEGLLVYCPRSRSEWDDREVLVRLVIPERLQTDFLHHYHTSLEGRHQGIGRTYQRLQRYCHWRGLFRSVQRYVGSCVDCETGKGGSTLQGKSPGNVEATYLPLPNHSDGPYPIPS